MENKSDDINGMKLIQLNLDFVTSAVAELQQDYVELHGKIKKLKKKIKKLKRGG